MGLSTQTVIPGSAPLPSPGNFLKNANPWVLPQTGLIRGSDFRIQKYAFYKLSRWFSSLSTAATARWMRGWAVEDHTGGYSGASPRSSTYCFSPQSIGYYWVMKPHLLFKKLRWYVWFSSVLRRKWLPSLLFSLLVFPTPPPLNSCSAQ